MKRFLLLFSIIACWLPSSAQLTAPFTESFNSTSIPVGWANTSSSTSANGNWKFSGTPGNPSMSGSAYNPPVILDHTQNNGSIAWSDGSSPAVADCGLMTDSIDISGLTSLWLEFWYYSNNVTNPGDNNTLYVNFYDGTQWNDSIWGYSGDGSAWQYGGVDLSTYTTSGKVLFEFVVDQTTATTAFYNDILLDDISVTNVPACPLPLNLTVSNISSFGADVNWNAVTAATSGYEVIYDTLGFDPATGGTSVNVTTNTANLTSLTGATTYQVYVIANCGATNGISDTAGPISFTTLCVPFTAPYTNNFDADSDGQVAQCWEQYNNFSSSAYARVEAVSSFNATQPRSAPNVLEMYSYTGGAGDTLIAISPQFSDLTAGDKQINFWAATVDVVNELYIATTSSQVPGSSLNYIDTITFSAADSWEEFIVPLTTANGYNGTDQYVVFQHSLGGTFDDIYIEDFVYQVIPPCPKVTGFITLNTTTDSAFFNWSSSGTAFDLEWGPTGFTQGTGTFGTASSTPHGIGGLSPNTTYDIYIRNNCTSSSNGVSVWNGPFTFTTTCASFTAPYTQNFDGTTEPDIDNCWTAINSTTSSSFVGTEGFANYSAPNSMELYNSGATSGDLMIVSPAFSDLDATKQIKFYVNDDDNASDLIIGTMTNAGDPTTFVPYDTITTAEMPDDTWQQFIVRFSNLTGTHTYIAFRHGMGTTFDNLYIDDFEYEVAPTCVPPVLNSLGAMNVTSNSADVFWGSGGQGLKTYIEVGTPGFVPGTGAQVVLDSVAGTVDTTAITGLIPQTSYEFYIRDSCASGLSPWVGPIAFSTNCIPSILPYFEDFSGGSFPICWSRSNTTDVTYESTCGTQNDVIEINYTEEAITPIIDVSGTTSLEVSYLIGAGACTNDPEDYEHFYVEYWDGTQWVLAMDHDGTLPQSFTAQSFIIPQGAYTTNFRVRFNMIDGTTDAWQIDDVEVKQGPTCFDPAQLGVNSITDSSAVLSWVGSPGSTSYEVWFGPQGFYQGTQSTTGGARTFITSDTLLVDTLSSLTCYEYVVRGICSPNDTTLWVGPFSFCTKCPNLVPMNLPYFDGFEAYSGPVTQSGTFFCGPSYSWAVEDQGSSGSVSFSYTGTSGPSAPYNGSQSAGLASQSSNDPIFLIFTGDLSAYNNVPNLEMLLSFYFADHFDETGVDDKVWVRGDVSDPWIEILDWNAANATTNWQKFEIRLDSVLSANSQSFSSSTQVRWGQMDNASLTGGDGFSVDDFMLQASTCPAPTNLAVTNTTTTTADISWTTGGASNLQIEYGPRGFTPGTGQFASATTSPYTLTGLTAGTVYDLIIRDSCGVGDVSFPVGPVLFKTNCASGLSGTYTIGATGNFATFDSVSAVLNNCGVSGPVTFNIQPGTYTDHLHLLGVPGLYSGVPGLSATNTITFNGSGATLIYDGNGPQATVLLDGSGHITLDNMTIINNAASEGFGIFITGNSDSVTISNSTIIVDSSGSFASDVLPIVVSGDAEYDDDFTYGADVDGLTIIGNEIIGGYHGLQLYGNSTTNRSVNYIIEDNIIRNFYLSGIYMSYHDGVEVIGNTVRSDISVTSEDGIYMLDTWNYNVEENDIRVKDYGLYINDGNDGASATSQSTVINNMVVSTTDYAIYLNDVVKTNVYHNSTYGEPGIAINDEEDLDIQNNIFVSDNDFAFESFDPLDATTSIDYNLYYKTGSGDPFEIGVNGYTDLVAWQTADATRNVNSLEGDPLYVASDDLHVIGGLADDVGNNTLGVTTDIDGDPRPASGSTIVDMGADEYTAVSGDLAVINGDFRKGLCLTNTDSVEIWVKNLIGVTADFSQNPLTVTYDVTGPANTNGSVTINSGTLPAGDTLIVFGTGIDLSIPGNYVLNAYIDSNGVNSLAFNDTLNPAVDIDVDSVFVTTPKVVTLASPNDTVEICVKSSFFDSGSDFFFTEIRHFDATGAGPQPSYLTADDYIEITGVPGSDLGGITLEVYDAGGMDIQYTFPTGTLIGPNGTALIMHGQGAGPSQPANFMYDGRGTFTGLWSSGTDVGYVLKDGNTVIDAVTYDAFTFPASAGVTAADWTGQVTGTSGTAGIRLTGPDNNSAADWTVVSTSVTQDPQVLNANVPLPIAQSASGFNWTLNSTIIDTNSCTEVSPGVPGTYVYYANYTNSCGSFTDSVIVIVPSCLPPSGLAGQAASTTSIDVSWDTTGVGVGLNYDVQYGPVGFTPGSGTTVSVPDTSTTISNLPVNLCQDVYIRTSCSATDSSVWVGPVTVCPEEEICVDDFEQYTAGTAEGQSALFLPWQGNAGAMGDASISTAQANSGTQSLHLSNPTNNAADHDDVVAYFDTISSGLWKVSFQMYIPTGKNAYFNIQQNHAFGAVGTNLWGGEIYLMGNGTAEVEYTGSAGVVGTFTYTQAQWNEIATIIDLGNDSIWFELNGTSTGVGFDYSSSNGMPLQFNGVNFYTGKRATDPTSSEFFIDDFCVAPYSVPGVCAAPTGITAGNLGCDSVEVSWNSTSGNNSSIMEYGPTGFTPGTGTFVSFVNSPQVINGLTPGTTYDVYLADTCGTTDTSVFNGPVSFITQNGPLPLASFTATVNGFDVFFDGSASTNGTTYNWDFGDGSNGTGDTLTHTYATGGPQTVTLIVTNSCGTDDTTITVASIGMIENELEQNLVVYPNPTKGQVNISFDNAGDDVTIRVLDLSGKQVMAINAQAIGNRFEERINIGNLADGVYMLEISSGGMKANRRLIKQ